MRLKNFLCFSALLIAGCATHSTRLSLPPPEVEDADPNRADIPAQAPSLADTGAQVKVTLPPPPAPRVIKVSWENREGVPKQYPFSTKFFTALQATTNFVTWQEVARLPFQPWCSVLLTNRPACEFYRAVSGLK